ncbi:MAG: ArsR family transcriptional regulator [Balneolaceae bacterium]|nr:MAG: ArsR family transcriptional regulator [Balneolaceae bacterium]
MLETLISNKTRIKLLLRFFLNPEVESYLRELGRDFKETNNAIRVELNRFEKAGVVVSYRDGNRKYYKANLDYPLFTEFQQMAMKHFGLDQVLDQIVKKLGKIQKVYLTGELSNGLNSQIIDLVIIADEIDRNYLAALTTKVEEEISRKIRSLVLSPEEENLVPVPNVLLFAQE